MSPPYIIDGAGAILGRLASIAAKKSLLGKQVVVVNCDKVIITGNRVNIIEEWRTATRRGGHSLKGPLIPRKNPEKIVKRTIRGMLSYKQQRGLEALKRIRCYAAVPPEYASAEKVTLVRRITNQTVQLTEPLRIYEQELGGGIAYDFHIAIHGGGKEAQIQAARLALAKALVLTSGSDTLKKAYLAYDRNMLVADSRRKEAAKPNDSAPRAKRQKSYR